ERGGRGPPAVPTARGRGRREAPGYGGGHGGSPPSAAAGPGGTRRADRTVAATTRRTLARPRVPAPSRDARTRGGAGSVVRTHRPADVPGARLPDLGPATVAGRRNG
ncbi:MAG TPA: hypothetical protein VKP11_11840, partial [Frankiaceae bacterium]|nr:hypothetical protein [Frankiaceae bacterium]